MGYEKKLIIGKSMPDLVEDEGVMKVYFHTMATIDLCKCGHDSPITDIDWTMDDDKKTWYFYDWDGNTEVSEDAYGDKFKAVPISVVVAALREAVEDEEYRRFT